MTCTLNVGGTLFTTTLDTLNKSGYFSTMFNGAWKEKLNETIFIDRSPKGFQHILDFLRDPQYVIPFRYKYELEFYQVNYKDDNIERKCSQCNRCYDHQHHDHQLLNQDDNNQPNEHKQICIYCLIELYML